MSVPTNIAGQSNQPTVVGLGGVAASAKTDNSELGALFATLVSLTAPTKNTETTSKGASFTTQEQQAIGDLNADLTGLLLNTELKTPANTAELKTPANIIDPATNQALTDLLSAIQTLEEALIAGEPIDQELVDSAANALSALASVLEQSVPTAPVANGETKTPLPTVASAASHAPVSPETKPAENFVALQPTSQKQAEVPQQSTNTVQSATQETGRHLPTQSVDAREAIVAKLNQVIEKLGKLDKPLPELSIKMNQLVAKLGEGTTNQGQTTPTTASSSAPVDAKIANPVAALFSSKETSVARPAQTGTPIVNDMETGSAPRVELGSTKTQSTGNEPVPAKTGEAVGTPDRAEAKSNFSASSASTVSAASAGNATIAAAAKAEIGPHSDPLLIVQSSGQLTMNGEPVAVTKASTAPYQQAGTNLNLPHIAYEFARNVRSGASRFQIQLDPPHMGRIDVKMDIDTSGTLNARLVVERADTLDLLQRDSRALERALSQAGLDSSRTNLEFSLKQNPFARQDGQFTDGGENMDNTQVADGETADQDHTPELSGSIIYHGTASPGGVNMLA